MKYFRNRSEIADYLRISRMTLNRWEKIFPLVKGTLRSNAFHLDKSDVDAWYLELEKKYKPKQIPFVREMNYATKKR